MLTPVQTKRRAMTPPQPRRILLVLLAMSDLCGKGGG